MVNTKGIPKAKVLMALYNNSKPQGFGFMQSDSSPMTEEEASSILKQYGPRPYFDYLKGRVMKVDLSDDEGFEERLYDRDNGPGAASKAIGSIRGTFGEQTPGGEPPLPKIASIVSIIEEIANKCEAQGFIKEATELDIVANTLEAGMLGSFGSAAWKKVQDFGEKILGKKLDMEAMLNFLKEHGDKVDTNMLMQGAGAKEMLVNPSLQQKAAALGGAKQLALLATMIAFLLASEVEARNKPMTFMNPFTKKVETLSPSEQKKMLKADPKSYAIMKEQAKQYEEQQEKGKQDELARQKQFEQSPQMTGEEKPVKGRKIFEDDFGNSAVVTYYGDNTVDVVGEKDIVGPNQIPLSKILKQDGYKINKWVDK